MSFVGVDMGVLEQSTDRVIIDLSRSYLNSRFRRSLDTLGAVLLLVALIPVIGLITVGISITSPGPILFRQRRSGIGMKPFMLLKFRTMYWAETRAGTVEQAIRGDSRVTPLGRFLRATSLDELPQLFNVVRGEMSLIGPRPHAVEHDRFYMARIPHYVRRFEVRPGLTGLAQISGARGGTPRIQDMRRRVDIDLEYIENASLPVDCLIFLQTVREVFESDSAY